MAERRPIARAQDEVLAHLGAEDYRSNQPFGAVPAMAGTVLTERGLGRVLAHTRVRRVDVDAAGRGGAPIAR